MDNISLYNLEGSTLRKAQLRMLSMLDAFVSICEKHEIDYWLHAGTALGARRHQGFIPWDDDLDVAVLQKDYKRLCAILEKELPSNLKLQTRKTDKNYDLFFAKIRDLNSFFNEGSSESYKYRGIFIDIFPLVNDPSYFFKKVIDIILNSHYSYLSCKKLKFLPLIMLIPLANLTVKVRNMFFSKRKTDFLRCNFGIKEYKKYDWSIYYPIGKITFEGKKYNVPGDVNGYLLSHYGNDYMIVPPKDKRKIHTKDIKIY